MGLDSMEAEIGMVHKELKSGKRGFSLARAFMKPKEGPPSALLKPSARAEGKRSETARTLAISVSRPIIFHEGAAPTFGKLGTNLIGNVISAVTPDSPAEIAGLREFDRLLSVDGELVHGGADALGKLLQHKRTPLIRVERPPRSAWAAVAASLAASLDEEWLAAMEACHVGDAPLALTCLSILSERGVAWAERRLAVLEADALELRLRAASDESYHGAEGGSSRQRGPPAGTTLVEVALERGHEEIVQVLLSGPDDSWPPAGGNFGHSSPSFLDFPDDACGAYHDPARNTGDSTTAGSSSSSGGGSGGSSAFG